MCYFLVVCVLEGSGKWPDSIDAIRRLKAAYYLALSEALRKTAPSVLSAAYTDYLEVYKVRSKIVLRVPFIMYRINQSIEEFIMRTVVDGSSRI